MIYLKTPAEIETMRKANQIVVDVQRTMRDSLKVGLTTLELDNKAEKIVLALGGRPAFKGYRGFAHTLCVSVNEEVVHGIPGKRRLEEGDLVSIDCGVLYEGFYGDHAWTYPIGKISESAKHLLSDGEMALKKGIEQMTVDHRLFDISAAIESFAEAAGYGVVRDFVGHGIGKSLHEDPQLPNFGKAGTGMRLKPGLVLACEPMLNAGTHDVVTLPDGWTVVTKDKSLSVHFEHSVAITKEGPDILSLWND